MYKVLIVDDEPRIRDGLSTLIDWGELGFVVVDKAANGIEAMNKYKRLEPDLIIADIRMPEMNGLELVKAIRSAGGAMHVLILSGYADFEYAKQAMTLRIDGYLLKPVDEDELMDYLAKLKKELDQESEYKRSADRERGTSTETAILAMLSEDGAKHGQPQAIREWDAFEVVLIKPHGLGTEEALAYAQIRKNLEDKFEPAGRGIVFQLEPYIGLLLSGGYHREEWSRRLLYQDIQAACAEYADDFTAAAGNQATVWSELRSSYLSALDLMRRRFFLESETIATAGSGTPFVARSQACSDKQALDGAMAGQKLYWAVDIGKRESIVRQVEEAAAALIKLGRGETEFKAEFVQLLSDVLDKLSVSRPEFNTREYRARLLELYTELHCRSFLHRIVGILVDIADSIECSSGRSPIARMIDLIHRNYSDNLKLEKLAELFNYNSAYLGKLFKSETGEHFNTYLDKVRIEHAKKLLEQGMKVYQAADKVGYANVDYFHAKFRKYEGASPSAYKKK